MARSRSDTELPDFVYVWIPYAVWIRPFIAVTRVAPAPDRSKPGCTAGDEVEDRAGPPAPRMQRPRPPGRRTRRPFTLLVALRYVTQSFAIRPSRRRPRMFTTHRNAQRIHATEKPQPNARHTTQRRDTQAFLFPTERGGWRDTIQCYISTESSFKANTTCVLYATLQGQLSCQIVSSIHVTTHAVAERHSHAALSSRRGTG